MRFCVVGAGAVGTYVGARLQRAGEEVIFLARGAQLDALQLRGVEVREDEQRYAFAVRAESDAASIGPVDVVILAVKAHQVVGAIPAIRALYAPHTTLLTLQNGIPWWYTYEHPQAAGWNLASVDPQGTIARELGADRAVGGIVYFHANLPAPGVVARSSGMRLALGEPANGPSARLESLATSMRAAGFDAPLIDRIRPEVWAKLLGNVNFNPISALTHAYVREIADDPATVLLVREMMVEALAVARALGDEPDVSIDARIAESPLRGDVRTSMLQDREAGRPMEIAPIVGAVVELGERTGVATPAIRHVHTLVALLDRTLAARRLR